MFTGTMSSMQLPFFASLNQLLLFFISLRVGQIQYRIDNSGERTCRGSSLFGLLFPIRLYGMLFFFLGGRE